MCIQSQAFPSYTTNSVEAALQKIVMVPNNHKHRQSSFLKIKAQQVKTYEGDLQNWGIPLTVITKETVQAKTGIIKSKKKEVLKILNKKKRLQK